VEPGCWRLWIGLAGMRCQRQVIWLPFHRDQIAACSAAWQPRASLPERLRSAAKEAPDRSTLAAVQDRFSGVGWCGGVRSAWP